MLRSLERAFGQSFAVIECATGQVAHDDSPMLADRSLQHALRPANKSSAAADPKFWTKLAPLLLFAVPLVGTATGESCRWSRCTVRHLSASNNSSRSRRGRLRIRRRYRPNVPVGRSANAVAATSDAGSQLPPSSRKSRSQQSAAQLKRQMADISSHLLMTFEEITLLHRLTEHLSISQSVTDICELSVNWLGDVIPAKAVAIWFESFEYICKASTLGQAADGSPCSSPTAIARSQQDDFSTIHRAARVHASPPSQSCSTAAHHELADLVLSGCARDHLRADPRRQPPVRLVARAQSHRRRRHHQQRSRVRHRRSLPDGQRGHDPGHSLRQHRAVPRAIGILQQRRAGTHLRHRRQRSLHLRSQRSRGPPLRVPGPPAGLQLSKT